MITSCQEMKLRADAKVAAEESKVLRHLHLAHDAERLKVGQDILGLEREILQMQVCVYVLVSAGHVKSFRVSMRVNSFRVCVGSTHA